MTATVLVPSDEGRAALAGLDHVSLVVYDPGGAMPDEAVDAEVLVVPLRRARSLRCSFPEGCLLPSGSRESRERWGWRELRAA